MGTISVNYPDAQGTRIRDALCTAWNYDGENGGLSKQAFVKRGIARMLKEIIVYTERLTAEEAIVITAPDIEE